MKAITVDSTNNTSVAMIEARKAYLADLRARAQGKGESHGLSVGLALRSAVVHTQDTASTATTATVGYTKGFGTGFMAGIRG